MKISEGLCSIRRENSGLFHRVEGEGEFGYGHDGTRQVEIGWVRLFTDLFSVYVFHVVTFK